MVQILPAQIACTIENREWYNFRISAYFSKLKFIIFHLSIYRLQKKTRVRTKCPYHHPCALTRGMLLLLCFTMIMAMRCTCTKTTRFLPLSVTFLSSYLKIHSRVNLCPNRSGIQHEWNIHRIIRRVLFHDGCLVPVDLVIHSDYVERRASAISRKPNQRVRYWRNLAFYGAYVTF